MTQTNTLNEVKSPVKSFSEAFDNLKNKDRGSVRTELMNSLGWAISTFYIKKNNLTPIKESEIPVIESIFRKYGINAWNGKK